VNAATGSGPACRELEPLLAERAAGDLAPADAARLDAHLAGCARCRAEAAAFEQALGLARLPPPDDAERLAAAPLRAGALADIRRAERRRTFARAAATGFAVAAAAALFILAPAAFRDRARGRLLAAAGETSATGPYAEASWTSPDPDTLWEDAGVLDDDSNSSDSAETDAALAALDAGQGI